MSKNRLALPAVFLLLSPALAFGDESVETAAAKARAQLPRAAAYAKHSLNGIPADEQRQLIAEANSRFARIDAAQEFIRNSAEFLGLQSAQGKIYATYQNKHAQYITERYTCKDDVCRDRVEKKRTQL
ncbi:MAG: hypothetical protein HY551_02115, partial [Elusimicrobia bacterium]|nr:hypothetical protein [Elusimicrobiota bacterium]